MKKEKEIRKYEKPALNRLDAGVKGSIDCETGYIAANCFSGPAGAIPT